MPLRRCWRSWTIRAEFTAVCFSSSTADDSTDAFRAPDFFFPMYDIKQFRPALYFVLALGITGFSMAVEAPALWVLAGAGVGLHVWLTKTGRFRPLPRWVANVITVLALLLTFQAVRSASTPIVTIDQFLVFLQLVRVVALQRLVDPGSVKGADSRFAAAATAASTTVIRHEPPPG